MHAVNSDTVSCTHTHTHNGTRPSYYNTEKKNKKPAGEMASSEIMQAVNGCELKVVT